MSLILLLPMLNTIKLPTLSALRNIFLKAEKLPISLCFTIRYQASSGDEVFVCFLEKSSNRFRVIICTLIIVSHFEIIRNALCYTWPLAPFLGLSVHGFSPYRLSVFLRRWSGITADSGSNGNSTALLTSRFDAGCHY